MSSNRKTALIERINKVLADRGHVGYKDEIIYSMERNIQVAILFVHLSQQYYAGIKRVNVVKIWKNLGISRYIVYNHLHEFRGLVINRTLNHKYAHFYAYLIEPNGTVLQKALEILEEY